MTPTCQTSRLIFLNDNSACVRELFMLVFFTLERINVSALNYVTFVQYKSSVMSRSVTLPHHQIQPPLPVFLSLFCLLHSFLFLSRSTLFFSSPISFLNPKILQHIIYDSISLRCKMCGLSWHYVQYNNTTIIICLHVSPFYFSSMCLFMSSYYYYYLGLLK